MEDCNLLILPNHRTPPPLPGDDRRRPGSPFPNAQPSHDHSPCGPVSPPAPTQHRKTLAPRRSVAELPSHTRFQTLAVGQAIVDHCSPVFIDYRWFSQKRRIVERKLLGTLVAEAV
ncbi:unnamed protein product [Cuscuta epithymum]|uniref:Uncharacterized protein n=1 Tax=Cuscuta epithymum TaxID=186058 RepID=A0AAV0DWF7_9ASTE|nr:unnamed protein product [Cuscuta epithymum]